MEIAMARQLPIPFELRCLIEKREREEQRRAARRNKKDRRLYDLGPLGALESDEDLDPLALSERRNSPQRRNSADRRRQSRRKRGG
jgi:hypothetical protein